MALHVLPASDATLWWVQRPDLPLQVAGLALIEGGPLHDSDGRLRLADLTARVEASLADAPRLRQRVRQLPLHMAVAFEDDPDFDLSNHIRSTVLPSYGGSGALRREIARILQQPLDLSRPLWEIWLIDGVEGDRVAMVLRASHVLVDGMALLELATRFLDPTPEPRPLPPPSPWQPEPSAGLVDSVATGAAARTRALAGAARRAASLATDPHTLPQTLGALLDVTSHITTPSSSAGVRPPFSGPVGPRHEVAWTSVSLEEVHQVAQAHAATVNDVVMTMTTGAVADYVAATAPSGRVRSPRVIVPVSVHGADLAGEVRNEFSILLADLPVDLRDPVGRLRVIHEVLGPLKRNAHTSLGARVFELALAMPPCVLRPFGRAVLDRQPVVDLAVTNLPGPADDLYLMGARVLEMYPVVVGTGNIATIVGVLSYRDRLGICVTVDAGVVPDPEVLLAGFARSLRALLS